MIAFYCILDTKKTVPKRKTIHLTGFPESIDNKPQEILPLPDVLLILKRKDGVFLERYTLDGEPGGDTWHLTIEDAMDQATQEYHSAITKWIRLPNDIEDVTSYAISKAKCYIFEVS